MPLHSAARFFAYRCEHLTGLMDNHAIEFFDTVAHCFPRKALAFFDAILSESFEGIAFIDTFHCLGDTLDGRRADIPYPTIRNDFGQTTYISHDHRCTELIGYLCYAALCGALVGLYDAISRREIITDLVVGDESVVQ